MLQTQDTATENHKNSLHFIQTTYKLFCVVYSRVLKAHYFRNDAVHAI